MFELLRKVTWAHFVRFEDLVVMNILGYDAVQYGRYVGTTPKGEREIQYTLFGVISLLFSFFLFHFLFLVLPLPLFPSFIFV
jgi:hypothetical protein